VKAHFNRELHAEMAEPTNAENGDEIARACPAITQAVKCSDTGAAGRLPPQP
jgi:hypothetical protein